MAIESESEFIAECLWPGVRESDLRELDERAEEHVRALAAGGACVRYLGSELMREDEVVLCRFYGRREAVREAAQAAAIPFERLLETAHSPWSSQSR